MRNIVVLVRLGGWRSEVAGGLGKHHIEQTRIWALVQEQLTPSSLGLFLVSIP